MTKSEIYNKLINDILRITDSTLTGKADWNKRAAAIDKHIHAGHIDLLRGRLNGPAAVSNHPNLPIVLQILAAIEARPDDIKGLRYIPEDVVDYISPTVKTLKSRDTTIVGYHAIELLGSKANLEQAIGAALKSPVSIRIAPAAQTTILAEHNKIFEIRPWMVTTLEPIVIVSRVTQ